MAYDTLGNACHQRNANQNKSKIPSYSCQNGQDHKHWWQLMLERLCGKGNTPPLLVGVQTSTAALEISMMIYQKIRKQPSSDPAISLLGLYSKDAQSYHKDMCSVMFIAALFVLARIWNQPKFPSTEEWIRKMWHIYTTEYYTVKKKIMTSWNLQANWWIREHHIEWGNSDPKRNVICTHN